ncbi:lipase secretion chaperone [Arenicella xantha]|uniref:Lipase chaperone n=1 Tax=Arenicella xantha TaxID=644221 RepID=A0A395JQ30_9GAMM|nr:lipase secretion chaperone [Arenicella xantha]RBP53770.1 lipase chaperone LimK [Arenicella xantha]
MKRTYVTLTATVLCFIAILLLANHYLLVKPPAHSAPQVSSLIERVASAKQTNSVSHLATSVSHLATNDSLVDEIDHAVAYSTPRTHDQAVISASLHGTDIDGALQADASGKLILNIGIRDFFDYFLSTADELGAEAGIDEIVRYAQAYLPAQAQHDALDLLENYLRYKQFEFELQQTPITNASMTDADTLVILRESYAQLKAERAARFSVGANQALFGLEDEYAEFTLRTLEVGANESLNPEQKAQQTDLLLDSLPAELAGDARQQQVQEATQKTLQSALVSEQDDSEIYDLLTAYGYPADEADRVIEYRQQQRNFDTRYQQYRNTVSQLTADESVASDALDQLKQRFFVTPEEQTQAALRDLGQE